MAQPPAASSTKPYFLRAMYEWCADNGYTPHIVVTVDANTRVPPGYVKNGEIVLNINVSATKDLRIANDALTFSARFSGNPFNIYVPVGAVKGIFARETGQGMFFERGETQPAANANATSAPPDEPPKPPPAPTGIKRQRPSLKIVK
ncbi:MAG: ClpXP protease specificity-enhancing factor [Methylobacillus sp.]|jgi:stringent starvation protein B|nr:ClpXP protease specificity-enhancing factor [Methylobacillus sp.]